ncbi:MAG: hypothetical protein C4290_09485, partial [Chloroflexota bacterium]
RDGATARLVAADRPAMPVLALTEDPSLYRRLALVWGVVPMLGHAGGNLGELLHEAERAALATGAAMPGETVLVLGHLPPEAPGSTNFLTLHRISSALPASPGGRTAYLSDRDRVVAGSARCSALLSCRLRRPDPVRHACPAAGSAVRPYLFISISVSNSSGTWRSGRGGKTPWATAPLCAPVSLRAAPSIALTRHAAVWSQHRRTGGGAATGQVPASRWAAAAACVSALAAVAVG